ncbi:pyrophosphate--fructose 6-phosphate 1-phosphotransferase [Reticulibacter mediterranei]|uniref:Pyrophosphate--fructose 6-phosphate 1-phosphotransferase n=1 Tax=Reticulibacter mediterranei TaxID=2778369 RepID=A0A8J3MYU3_9CHLR|nr:6-phosphofructokinase [Reticulibacter mediterranei]GHO91207.1 pyrophosphate--fructose 6-phosphate 1-phosphotransferase [Reticulibacter mediterranei]
MTPTPRGNLIIGQSGGATAVINASLVGVVEAALEDKRVDGIYGMLHGIEGLLKEDIIDLRQQPASLWPQLRHTPSAALGSCRYKLQDNDLEHVIEIFRRYNIRYMLYIGGNDSADTAHRLSKAAHQSNYDLSIISVPKTIDNDLPHTDHCPGYGSAARFLALATMDSTMNTISIPWHYPVKVIETMGRDAGWLTVASALGKRDEIDPPHIILTPEHPFSADRFLTQVEEIYRRIGYVIIVAAETIRDEKGQALGTVGQVGTDAFQHPLLSGAAQNLVELVKQHLKLRARFDKPGDLQRMASTCISVTDQQEAYLVGQMGTLAALSGESDKMVTLVRHDQPSYHCTTDLIDLTEIANVQRLLPAEYLDESKTMVTQSFYEYALPLIGEPLPQYKRLETTRLTKR